jgi:serine/threonine protein kinase
MSPEQVRGYAVDPRSDIFSFGVILYEALACERAFTGESPADTMSAILGSEPPEMPGTVTIGLHLIVRRCLEKNPERRFQTAQDLGFALEAIAGVKSNPRQEAVSAERWWRGKGAFAAIACLRRGIRNSAVVYNPAT